MKTVKKILIILGIITATAIVTTSILIMIFGDKIIDMINTLT